MKLEIKFISMLVHEKIADYRDCLFIESVLFIVLTHGIVSRGGVPCSSVYLIPSFYYNEQIKLVFDIMKV